MRDERGTTGRTVEGDSRKTITIITRITQYYAILGRTKPDTRYDVNAQSLGSSDMTVADLSTKQHKERMMDKTKREEIKKILVQMRQSKLIDLNAPAGDIIEKVLDAAGPETNLWAIYRDDKWVAIGGG